MSNEEVSSGIGPGTAVFASHDIRIGEELAFVEGERLNVEAVVPNADQLQLQSERQHQ